MDLRQHKRLLVTGVAAAALVGIGGGMSFAADGPSPAPAAGQATEDADEGTEGAEAEPEFTGSVPAPAEREDVEVGVAALQDLATTTQADAEDAALAEVPGTVVGTELEDDEGFVVYQVQVDASDGRSIEVTVDAGDGTVLAQSDSDDDDSGETADD